MVKKDTGIENKHRGSGKHRISSRKTDSKRRIVRRQKSRSESPSSRCSRSSFQRKIYYSFSDDGEDNSVSISTKRSFCKSRRYSQQLYRHRNRERRQDSGRQLNKRSRRRGRETSYDSQESSFDSESSFSSNDSQSHFSTASSTTATTTSRYADEMQSRVLSMDTAVNSESKLQDVGLVVQASDLSDYSDQFTLDSMDKQEFEDFLQKHDKGIIANIATVDSNDSKVYSLPATTEAPDIPGVRSADTGVFGGCVYRTFFCLDDDSVQGSYGGLRNGEVLIAASISLHEEDVTVNSNHQEHDDQTCDERSRDAPTVVYSDEDLPLQAGCKEKNSSDKTSHSSHAGINTEDSPGISKANDTPDDSTSILAVQPSTRGCFYFWGTSTPPSEAAETMEDNNDDDKNDSTSSHTIVWQRSETHDETSENSSVVSIDEQRAGDIAKKARDETVLSKFKPETEDSIRETDSPSLSGTIAFMSQSQSHSIPLDAPPRQTLFVLGDNAEISAVTEVEAGNGDTAFLIYIRPSRCSLSEKGEATVAHAEAFKGLHKRRNARSLNQYGSENTAEAELVVVDSQEDIPETERPKLILEDRADMYLEYLGKLSEASYYCLDTESRLQVTKVLEGQKYENTTDRRLTPEESQDVHSIEFSTEGAQYMFCIRQDENFVPSDEGENVGNDFAIGKGLDELPFDEEEGISPMAKSSESLSCESASKIPLDNPMINDNQLSVAIENELTSQRQMGDVDNLVDYKVGELVSKPNLPVTQIVSDEEVDNFFEETPLQQEVRPREFDSPLCEGPNEQHVNNTEIDQFIQSSQPQSIANDVKLSSLDKSENAVSSTQEEPRPKAMMGLSRNSAKAHAWLLSGKRSRRALAASIRDGTEYASRVPQKSEENATKSNNDSSSNHSFGINKYLKYLDKHDHTEEPLMAGVTTGNDIGENCEGKKEVTLEGNSLLPLSTDTVICDASSDAALASNKDDSRSTEKHESAIPSHVPCILPSHVIGHIKSHELFEQEFHTSQNELTLSDQRKLVSYSELARLSRNLLLGDNSVRSGRTSSQLHCRIRNESVGSSGDEFFDAVSRTSSNLSTD